MKRAAAAALTLLVGCGPAAAQSLPARPPLPPTPGEASPAPPASDASPPYEAELERLAERLGALALLRDVCGDGDAAAFRDRMAALMQAEAGSAGARERLAGAYNRGFDGYSATYRTCTPSAHLAITRALAEADRLTRDLQSRYGGA